MGPHAMALSWKINGVKSSPLIFGKGPQLYAQKTVTCNLLCLQMLLWCFWASQDDGTRKRTTLYSSIPSYNYIFSVKSKWHELCTKKA